MAYQHPEQLYYCGIIDDRDIRKLIKVINVIGDEFVFVYVVVEEGVSHNEVDDRGKVDINEEIKVLDIFDDKELLKLAIGRQCMEQGNQYNTTRSSKERFDVAWRAKLYALLMLRGTNEDSFTKLPAYLHNLVKHNPGTVTQIRTNDDDWFEFVDIALGCSAQTFIKYCRPILIIDGGHLKGEFKDTVLLAVTMDGQNQIMLVAYSICKSECTETWSWFLRKLHECIGNMEDLTFISDRAPSITTSIANIFPHAHHGKCGVHVNDCAWEYLQNINLEIWARAHFLGNRYFLMTSNSAKSINSMSRFARKMPILMLIEYFCATMQQWSFQKRDVATVAKTTLTPWVETIIEANKNACNNWMVRWQIDGLPCGHVIKVLTMNCYEDCSKFTLKAYFRETLRKTYEESVNPLPSPSEWEIPNDLMIVKPPIMERRQPSRSRNTGRIPSQGEHPIRQ
ncbi:uncharacterized protein LOC111907227 [Lactuca sativa]|uniref:uncharacterized protein LOC111907227 n=1 Tax=Lactuca sativa TaxID=4236 RepID=UPI000CD9BC12|nr:uncharacterized protein LOC111907227 [Lactuca sativa]